VLQPDGAPLPDYPVRAFDRAFSNWRPLGETRTNDLEHTALHTFPLSSSFGTRSAPISGVGIYDAPTDDTVLAASPLILRTLPLETVRFAIGKGPYRGLEECPQVDRALAPLQFDDDPRCPNVSLRTSVPVSCAYDGGVMTNVAYLKVTHSTPHKSSV
jgi:hypothetical protein